MHGMNKESIRNLSLYVGLIGLIVGMLMAFEYGRAMSMLHAASLGLLAVVVSIAFIAREVYASEGKHFAANMALIAGFAFSIGEYGTHFGYTVGTRVAETQQTGVTNATYAAIQKNRESEVANLDMWKAQLKSLLEANAWAATVKADALRGKLELANKEIADETARGGCKAKCNQRMKDRDDLSERIGKVEQAEDLSKRIEATQRILDKKVDVAAKTEFHSSKIVNQTAGFAQIVTWSDEPSASAMSWTQLLLGAVIAAITTYLAPFCLSFAFSGMNATSSSPNYAATYRASPQALYAQPKQPPQSTHTREVQPIIIQQSQAPNTKDDELRAIMQRLVGGLSKAYG
jgi:hypothetical protein